MKIQMMTLSQIPLLLHFCVRMLCCQIFFIVVFISSQTPFSLSDSTIFIAQDSYLYVESPTDIYATTSLSGKDQVSRKIKNTTQLKAFFKLKSPSFRNNYVKKSKEICFTIPKNSHYLGNSNISLSTAVLGNPSPVKQHQKMMGSALKVFLNINLSEKKLLYITISHFNSSKITINHFSRPPPYLLSS
ncbi:hypothetical protein [Chryseobacterium taichungense]|uniref:hypothetical protein n=1 Tax=Chryseobacterium taichungense TaxID=295069 RepID=UPI0028A8E5AE|nr:hypothetical protein [Chryseobacterium taichungense]